MHKSQLSLVATPEGEGKIYCRFCPREASTWRDEEGRVIITCSPTCASIPERFLHCSFENFHLDNKAMTERVKTIRAAITATPRRSIYICGPVGTGKTHLAIAAIQELRRVGLKGRFVRAARFFLECQESFRGQGDSLEQLIGETLKGDFLCLDDIGAVKNTEFLRGILCNIVDQAYGDLRPLLILTSNFDLELLASIDQRIPDRLVEMGEIVRLQGKSYRVNAAEQRLGARGSAATEDGTT
jgi:DNA replication protein DnaC